MKIRFITGTSKQVIMNTRTSTHRLFIVLIILQVLLSPVTAQSLRLLPPVVSIDFSSGPVTQDFNATAHPNYQWFRGKDCPDDGYYSYTGYTSNCFNNDWFTLRDDHTGGGNMMLVNASESGGSFFNYILTGLKENTKYELAVWFMNVCRINGGCSPLPPNIHIVLVSFKGRKVADFVTGQLKQGQSPNWKKYSGMFTMPAGETMLGLQMTNLTTGGCGNDFAMDDITVREYVQEDPPVVGRPKQPEPTITTKRSQPIAKSNEPTVEAAPQKSIPVMEKQEEKVVGKVVGGSVQPNISRPKAVIVPLVIQQRENPVVKTIRMQEGELLVDVYDNGQIDGDTISIYHNNLLLVSRAALTQLPISIKIPVSKKEPHHELILVAENLGSIPPNTSLMILKANGKRYDVFISSSEQKNAKIVVELEEAPSNSPSGGD